jgi:hypothetical protein
MQGKDDFVAGSLKTQIQGNASRVLPDAVNAEQHRKLTEPSSANKAMYSGL